jgi:hypothetical protein
MYLKAPETRAEAEAFFEYSFRQEITPEEVTEIYKNWANNYDKVSISFCHCFSRGMNFNIGIYIYILFLDIYKL